MGQQVDNSSAGLHRTQAVNEPIDRRSRRTREALRTALLRLLKTKPLKSITVSELAREADINRATFYTHYQDVNDLFTSLQNELCDVCRNIIYSHAEEAVHRSHEGLVHDVFEYFDDNVEVFDLMFDNADDESFFNTIMQIVYDGIITNMAPYEAVIERMKAQGYTGKTYQQVCRNLCDYQFSYAAGGVVNIIRKWIEGGRKESVDEITVIACGCTSSINTDLLYDNVMAVLKQER